MRKSVLLTALVAATLSTAAVADDRQEVIDAFTKGMSKGTFETRMKPEGKNPGMVMRVILPNRFHMKTEGSEMIMLPQGTWMNAGGQWMKMPMDMSKVIEGYSQKSIDEGMDALADVREIRSETVEGCDSTVYSYRTSGKFMGVENKSQAEVAICDDTGMPIRVVSLDGNGKPEATLYYDFSGGFEINPPN